MLILLSRGGDGIGEGGVDGVGVLGELVWSKAFAEGLQGGELGLRERRLRLRITSFEFRITN